MTHAERILLAVKELLSHPGKTEFTRKEIRVQLRLSADEWMSGYTAIFQAMRIDQPGRAPLVGMKYVGVFQRISFGRYKLTDYGKRALGLLN
jgi:hypothetical protein